MASLTGWVAQSMKNARQVCVIFLQAGNISVIPPEMSPTTSHKSSVAPRCSSVDVRLQTATSESRYQQYYSRIRTSSNCWQLRRCSLPLYRTWVIVTVLIKSQNWALISTIFTWIYNVTTSFPFLVSFAPFIASLPAVKMPNLNFCLLLKKFV